MVPAGGGMGSHPTALSGRSGHRQSLADTEELCTELSAPKVYDGERA